MLDEKMINTTLNAALYDKRSVVVDTPKIASIQARQQVCQSQT